MKHAVNVGASKDTIHEARGTILAIVGAACGDQVKVAALEALKSITSVNGTVIQNCSFTTK